MNNLYNPYPYGSSRNPVVITDVITTFSDYDILVTDTQIVTRIIGEPTSNPNCKRFFMEIPFHFEYGNTKALVFSDDSGTDIYPLYDKLGNYVRSDALIAYAGFRNACLRPRLLECIYLNDPGHVTILSPLCRTHYVVGDGKKSAGKEVIKRKDKTKDSED